MTLELSKHDQGLLEGEFGPGVQMAMRIIVLMARIENATTLMDISAAHIDSSLYMGLATLEFAERLASLGAKVVVPATSNVSGVDEHGWKQWSVQPEWAENAHRQMRAYQAMGCNPTWTCAPYQTEMRPTFGQQIAWGESNAIAFANSVIGARTERYPDLLDICAAITGRVPAIGLHLTENRAGQILVRLADIPEALQMSELFYPVLGHLLGKIAGEDIPVIENLAVIPEENQLKALCAAAASSGAVALLHIVGVTPEAPTLEAAFQGRAPQQIVEISLDILRNTYAELTTDDGVNLDIVALGCPHFSIGEFEKLAGLLEGKTRHLDMQFLVTSNRGMVKLAQERGYLEALNSFGGKITVDTCMLTTPMLPAEIKTIMTNSGKYAYYTPGLLERKIIFGSLEECVQSAVEGKLVREEVIWNA
ncbi:MAG: aconitase X catalytic domain-containing protein [Anaerolineaceae bacterium]|nr:aconitase X catalytic domain-containing protein [Anaerolineaceae bacterium]